jgi:PAS domain S-box-containing protein
VAPGRSRRPLSGRRTLALIFACLAGMSFMPSAVQARPPDRRLTQYLHTSWRIEDGSAPAGMFTVTQSPEGFLWFASFSEKIYRFDGVRFLPRTVSVGDKTIDPIVQVHAGRDGSLWVFGMHEIVHLRNGEIVSHLELPGIMTFRSVRENADGSLWIVRGFANVTHEPLCHVSDAGVQCFGPSDGITMGEAFALLADGDEDFWLGGQRQLVHWRGGSATVYPIEALRSNTGDIGVDALARGPDGTLWVGVQDGPGLGLGRLIGRTVEPFVTSEFDGRSIVVTALTFDHDGDLWVGTLGKGLFRIHDSVAEHYGPGDGLSGETVQEFLEDREGIMWVLTPAGVDSFRPPRITSLSAREGLGPAVVGVLAGRDGTIWVANNGSLDRIANGHVTSIRKEQGLPGIQVTSMLESSAGDIWVGVDDRLYVFKEGRFRHVPGPGGEPLGMVSGMTQDIDGDIWAACAGKTRQLVRIRGFEVRERYPAPKTPFGHVLERHPQGGLWISTTENWDLLRFRDGAFERFPLHLGNVPVFSFHAAADGSALVASVEGLVMVRDGKVQRMTTRNGLPCNSVVSVVQDHAKRWWLSTDCGIVALPDSELQRWWDHPDAIVQNRVFDVLDGARPQGRPSFNAAALAPDGRVWFATGLLLQVVDPAVLSLTSEPAATSIDSITVDRKEIAVGRDLRFPPNPRDVQIDYTSPTLLMPQKVKFRYRLDNYDQDWHDAGTRRQAFYNDLPPGTYSFRAMASHGDGVWNSSATMLDFSVAPAFYQTNWFRALGGFVLLCALWGTYQLRSRQLRRESRRLQDVVETIPAMIFEVGPDGSGAFANRRWLEYTGSSPRQQGRFAPEDQAWRDATCIHPEDLDRYVRLWERAIETGEPFELETRVRRTDGEYRWFLARHVPLRDKRGKTLKWFGTLTDIEDRKQVEQEREKLHELEADLAHINRVSMMGELSASIAHEVNQPLSGVVSNGGACLRWLAGEEPNLEEAREAARRIVRDGKRAGDVIARIRALTRRAEAPREPMDLNGTIREVVALIGDQAKRNRVRISTEFADDLFPVLGDPVQLQQVVLNLTMNAIEAMSGVDERARELVISTRSIDADQAHVTVEDTGTGLDPGAMPRIFDAFFTTKPGGMGMGLSICRSIVQAHGGRLWATGRDGAGTVFHFTLPRHREETANARVTRA